jgi:hypothetical protein
MALVCDERNGLPLNFMDIRTPVIIELEFMQSHETFLHNIKCWSTKKDGLKDQMMAFHDATRTRSMKTWATRILTHFTTLDSWIGTYKKTLFDEYIVSIRSEWCDDRILDISAYSIDTGRKILRYITDIETWLDSVTRNLHQIRNAALLREATHPTPMNRVIVVWSGTSLNEVDELGGHLDTHANRIDAYLKS